jgi:hypothetical protein
MKYAPPPEQVAVYDVITGATLLRWSVDAREMVRTGAYSFDSPVVLVSDVTEQQPGEIADAAAYDEAVASGVVVPITDVQDTPKRKR